MTTGVDREVGSLTFSADSRNLFSGSGNALPIAPVTLLRWPFDPPGGAATPVASETESVNDMTLAPNGGLAYSTRKAGLRLFDPQTESSRTVFDFSAGVDRIRYSPDGRFLAATDGGDMLLFDAVTGRRLRDFVDSSVGAAHTQHVSQLAFHPVGGLLVSASRDKVLKVWDVPTGRLLLSKFLGGADVVYPQFSPTGRFLAVTNDTRTLLYEITGHDLLTAPVQSLSQFDWFDVTGDGELLAGLSLTELQPPSAAKVVDGARLTLWDAGTGTLLAAHDAPQLHNDSETLAISPKGEQLLFANGLRRLQMFDLKAAGSAQQEDDGPYEFVPAEQMESEDPALKPRSLSFGHDKRVWAIVQGSHVESWTSPGFTMATDWSHDIAKVISGTSQLAGLAVSRRWVAVGADAGYVYLLDPNKGQPATVWSNPGDPVYCVAIDRAGGTVAWGTLNGRVYLAATKAPTAKPVLLASHRQQVNSVDFSPDGNWLASASEDATVRLFRRRPEGFERWVKLPSPTGPVVSARFFAGGKRLAVLMRNEPAIRVWRLDALSERFQDLGLTPDAARF